MSINKRMGDQHEDFLADLLGGRQTRGSGNQWRDPIDGRHNRKTEDYAFAWDGKSTLALSIGITRVMWQKAKDQAGGERPMLGLRFYPSQACVERGIDRDKVVDLVAVSAYDFAEVLEAGRKSEEVRRLLDRYYHTPMDPVTFIEQVHEVLR